jgi:hypothetical protein
MRRLAAGLTLALLALAACSDSTSPTNPETPVPDAAPAKPDESLRTLPGCPTDAQIRSQIDDLFRGPLKLVASAKYLTLRALMIPRNHGPAQKFAVDFVDWTLEQFNAGRLIGGKSDATQTRTIAFIQAIYCAAGLPQPDIPEGALDSDGAAVVVMPSNTTTTVVTETKNAGIQIPANGVTEPTLITVTRIPGQLLTQLDQYPLYYEFHATPELPGNVDVVVGVCIANDLTPPDVNRLRVAHNVPDPDPTTIEILPLAPAPFLDCTNATSDIGLGLHPTLWDRLTYALATTGRAVRSVLAPSPLYATALTTGLGGTTKKLSPFGVVDTLITVTAVSPTHITGIAGAPVPPSVRPSVRVATPTNRPVTNYPVTFAVPSGSEGSVTGGSALTNGSGVATVGSWTLGSTLGTDQVNATVAPPHLNSGVAGSPVAFSATVEPSTPVGYKSAGYSYSLIGSGPAPSGWETAAYTGVGGWPIGAAGFGTNFAADGCTIVSDIQTAWPAAASTSTVSDLLLRKSVIVPDGWTGGLSIAMAIDNDAQVFVNGVDITATAGVPVGGFMVHEGCATRGSLVFTAPNNILLPGADNLIAVRARDRGRTAFFDMQVTLVP